MDSTLHSEGFLSSGIEDFLLKPPCIDSVDMLSAFNSTFGWIQHYIQMDSFHPVLKIFYSNPLVSRVLTCSLPSIVHFGIEDFLLKLPCIDSVDMLSVFNSTFLLKPPCIDSVDMLSVFNSTFRIPDEPHIDSVDIQVFHPVSTVSTCSLSSIVHFYSNHLVSTVSTCSLSSIVHFK